MVTVMEPVEISVPIFRPILDVLLIVLGFIPLILLNTIVAPFERGFYCDDESIRYPHKANTIPSWANYLIGGIVAAVVISVVEIGHLKKTNRIVYVLKGKKINSVVSSVYIYFGYCLIGFIITQTVTDTCKVMLGRLRPNFIDVCKPSPHPDNICAPMKPDAGYTNLHRYIHNDGNQKQYECTFGSTGRTSESLNVLADARMSFPSGHSSYASYMMVFLALYIHARWPWTNFSVVLKHFIQLGMILWAVVVGTSRMMDYKHHWSDVLGGFGLGSLVACITAVHFGKFFQRAYFQKNALPVIVNSADAEKFIG